MLQILVDQKDRNKAHNELDDKIVEFIQWQLNHQKNVQEAESVILKHQMDYPEHGHDTKAINTWDRELAAIVKEEEEAVHRNPSHDEVDPERLKELTTRSMQKKQ
jgi:hypothetical protein